MNSSSPVNGECKEPKIQEAQRPFDPSFQLLGFHSLLVIRFVITVACRCNWIIKASHTVRFDHDGKRTDSAESVH